MNVLSLIENRDAAQCSVSRPSLRLLNRSGLLDTRPDRVRVALEQARLIVAHLEDQDPDLRFIQVHALALYQFVDGVD